MYTEEDDEIVEIRVGHKYEFGILTPVNVELCGMELAEMCGEKVLIAKEDVGLGKFCFPSFMSLSRVYCYWILFKKPFWILIRKKKRSVVYLKYIAKRNLKARSLKEKMFGIYIAGKFVLSAKTACSDDKEIYGWYAEVISARSDLSDNISIRADY